MTMITPSYLGETIEYSSLHACRSTLEDPNRDLRYTESDPADMLAQMVSYGMPEELAHAVIEQFRSTLKPFNSEPTADITAVTSRPARSFTDWAQAHRTELLTPASW